MTEVRRSACPLDCPDACSLAVTVDDAGRVVEVTGDERAPITNGFVCGKVRKIADHLYGADRVLHPAIRGEQKWYTKKQPGWANPADGSFKDPRTDVSGPLPAEWARATSS